MRNVIIYLFLINIISVIIMGIDKKKAKKHMYRISENTLMSIALIGGSVGTLLEMYVFHHKTKKKKFTVGVPIILLLQSILFYYMCI